MTNYVVVTKDYHGERVAFTVLAASPEDAIQKLLDRIQTHYPHVASEVVVARLIGDMEVSKR